MTQNNFIGQQSQPRKEHGGNSRNQILHNTVESSTWNYDLQNRAEDKSNKMLQEKNYQHQVTASQTELRVQNTGNQVLSAGKQSSSISTKEYLRAYILSGEKKPMVSLSNENSFLNSDPTVEQRQSKTELKPRVDALKLNFQQISQESESYYQVLTLPNDKTSIFDDRPPIQGSIHVNNADAPQILSMKNDMTPIDDEINYYGRELSQQKIPVKLQSAKIERQQQASREQQQQRSNGRLKVKGNIKEFISKQQVGNNSSSNIKANKANQKYSNNVLYSEASNSNNTSGLYYQPQQQRKNPPSKQPYHYDDIKMRDFSHDGLRLRNASKSITKTYPQNGNYKKEERGAVQGGHGKSPKQQQQQKYSLKETLKTQSPVLAQKQQKLQMATNPYISSTAINKSDKKPITSSQKVISNKQYDHALIESHSPQQQPNFVKSKADYLYTGASGKQGYQNYQQQQQQQSYYDSRYKKHRDLYKGHSSTVL